MTQMPVSVRAEQALGATVQRLRGSNLSNVQISLPEVDALIEVARAAIDIAAESFYCGCHSCRHKPTSLEIALGNLAAAAMPI